MSRKHILTESDKFEIDFYYAEYEKRYARNSPASYKEMYAILGVSQPHYSDDDIMIYMLDRVGQPGWRGEKDRVPHFPNLPRK